MKYSSLIFGILILGLMACKESYTPETSTENKNILVVDGFINTGNDSTFIRLSRTVPLQKGNTNSPETGATVMVQTSTNEVKTLVDKGNGLYVSGPLSLGNNKKYRISIRTRAGVNYFSEYVDPIVSPAIDSVNYKVDDNGLKFFVNTKDPNNKTHYYRWEYEETWQFSSYYYSFSMWDGGPTAVDRPQDKRIDRCWASNKSTGILIGSSIKLNQDVIYLQPLTDVEAGSEKISIKYSILVKQYALSKKAFEFWQNLKKNTETLGSIFDVLPSQLTGNVKNGANAKEPVIGYVGAGTTQKTRLFVTAGEFPRWPTKYPYSCPILDTVLVENQPDVFPNEYQIPVDKIETGRGILIGHLASSKGCTDCTIRGSVKKPSFWP